MSQPVSSLPAAVQAEDSAEVKDTTLQSVDANASALQKELSENTATASAGSATKIINEALSSDSSKPSSSEDAPKSASTSANASKSSTDVNSQESGVMATQIGSTEATTDIDMDWKNQLVINKPILPSAFDGFTVCASTHIGRRKNQEDRFTIAPRLMNGELAFFGVFDGTVEAHASEWIHSNIIRVLYNCPSFVKFCKLTKAQRADRNNRDIMVDAVKEMYARADKELIAFCAEHEYHYSSCTSVTCLVHLPSRSLYVAHIADSHAVVGLMNRSAEPRYAGFYLTHPHRPDHEQELRRIEASGGSLVYLHMNKPFIRGGDFHQRKQAMQLNYSRAFGGKDLKPYGLSSIPDIKIVDITFRDTPALREICNNEGTSLPGEHFPCLILGSDGVWDVVSATDAVNGAMHYMGIYSEALAAHQARIQALEQEGTPEALAEAAEMDRQWSRTRPQTPTEALVQLALEMHDKKRTHDNTTAIAVYF